MLLKIDILGHEINPGTKAYQTGVCFSLQIYTNIYFLHSH